MKEILVVSNLSKTFKLTKKQQKINKTDESLKVAVDDLSFVAYEGEIYGLLGPNGAGKTTTLRMISTLIKPDKGDVLIDGYSVLKEPDEVRRRIGFLTSELKLEDFFTPNYLFDYFSELYKIDKEVSLKRKEELFKNSDIVENCNLGYPSVVTLLKDLKKKLNLDIDEYQYNLTDAYKELTKKLGENHE